MRLQEKLTPVKHCVFRGIFVLGLALGAWGFPALASAQENCQLKVPPRQAAVEANHGFFFFVHPRSLNATYSGCQIMWDEKGTQVFVLTFEQGSVIKFESNDPSDASRKQSCRYEHGQLARNEPKDCLDYGRIKDGIRTLPSSDEPIVPLERDPRR